MQEFSYAIFQHARLYKAMNCFGIWIDQSCKNTMNMIHLWTYRAKIHFHTWLHIIFSFDLLALAIAPSTECRPDKWVTRKIRQDSRRSEEMREFLGERAAKGPFYQIEHILVLKSWRLSGSWVREIVSASKSQLSLLVIPISPTVDSRLFPDIPRQAYNSLFGKISCILVNRGMWERRREGLTMSRFQISCILAKWGPVWEREVTMSRWGRR